MDADTTTRFVPEHRRTNFKNRGHFKADELRRRREDAQVEIRKAKRDDNLAKRRNMTNISSMSDSEDEADNSKFGDVQVCQINRFLLFLFVLYPFYIHTVLWLFIYCSMLTILACF